MIINIYSANMSLWSLGRYIYQFFQYLGPIYKA